MTDTEERFDKAIVVHKRDGLFQLSNFYLSYKEFPKIWEFLEDYESRKEFGELIKQIREME